MAKHVVIILLLEALTTKRAFFLGSFVVVVVLMISISLTRLIILWEIIEKVIISEVFMVLAFFPASHTI